MGDIGRPVKEVEFEPIPAEPAPVKEPQPQHEPVPA